MATKVEFEVDVNTGNSINSIKGLEEAVESLKKEISSKEIGSKEFKALSKELTTTESKLLNVKKKIEGVDTAKLAGSFAKLGEGLAGGFAVATGALGLFGKKSEEVEQAKIKAEQAIALVLGARAIAEAVVEGRVAAKLIVEKAAAVGTYLLAVAQRVYTAVVGQSTGALKLFKIALASTGIGAIVILLAELIFNFDTVNKYIKQAINYIRDFASNVSNGNKVIKGFVEVLIFVASPLVTIIRLISDWRGTIQDLQNGIANITDYVVNFTDKLGFVGDIIRANIAAFNTVINFFKNLGGEAKAFTPKIEDLTKMLEENNKAIDKQKAKRDEAIRTAKAQGASEKELADLTRKSLEATIKAKQFQLAEAQRIADAQIRINGSLSQSQKDLLGDVEDGVKKSETDLLEFNKGIADAQNAKWKAAADARKKIFEDNFLALKNITTQALLEIENIQADTDVKKLALQYSRDQKEIQALYDKTNKSVEAQKARDEALLALEQKFGLMSKELQDNTNKELQKNQLAAQTDTFNKIQSLTQQHLMSVAQLRKLEAGTPEEILAADLALVEALYNQQLAALTAKNDKDKEIELQKLQDKLITQQQFDEFSLAQESEFITQKEILEADARAKDIALNKAAEEKKKADRKALVEQSFALGKQFIDALSRLNTAATDAELEAAGDNEVEKEKIRKASFERQKALNIVLAVINTAQAIVAALNAPPPLSFISAAIAGVTGGIEIATIAAQQYTGSSSGGGGGGGAGNIPSIPSISGSGQNFDPSVIGQAGGNAGGDSTTGSGTSTADNAVKVYVVESDITKTQQKVKVIENNAKF